MKSKDQPLRRAALDGFAVAAGGLLVALAAGFGLIRDVGRVVTSPRGRLVAALLFLGGQARVFVYAAPLPREAGRAPPGPAPRRV